MLLRTTALIVIIMAMIRTGTIAQDVGRWDDACVGQVVDNLSSMIDSVDYPAMCQVYSDCLYGGEMQAYRTSCEASVYGQFTANCAENDIACRDNVQFYTGFINAFEKRDDFGISLGVPEEALDDMLMLAEVYEAGDIDTALDLLEMWQSEAFTISYAIEAMQGAVLERFGDSEGSLAVYDASISRFELIPLMYWIRGDFQLRQANETLAAANYLMLDYIAGNDAILGEQVQALSTAHPLEGRTENWVKYPDTSQSYGVSGNFVSDRSYDEAVFGTLTFYNDDKNVILRNLSALIMSNRASHINRDDSLVILEQTEPGLYSFTIRDADMGNSGIRLQFSADGARLSEKATYFEGESALDSWLLPEGAPDPRASLDYLCQGAARSRLSVGDSVASALWNGTILYFDAPQQFSQDDIYNSNQTTTMKPVRIIGGHECGFGSVWWQILTAEGETAWMPEAANMVYQVSALENVDCDNAPPSRLIRGWQGRVVIGLGANNLRESYDVNSSLIGTLQEGEQFTVLSDVRCENGLPWVQISTQNGVMGWTAEGQGDDYWLEPVPLD